MIADDLNSWAAATMLTLDYTEDGSWYITNRGDIHEAIYTVLADNNLDSDSTGIGDNEIDTIVNGTIEILLNGYMYEWTAEQWYARLTDVIYMMDMTTDELYALVMEEEQYWLDWMYSNEENYTQWLEDNDEQKDAFVALYHDDLLSALLVEDVSELDYNWQQFFSVGWDDEVDISNKEQRELDNLENLEEELESDASWERWYALSSSLDEIYNNRLTRGVDTDASATTASDYPEGYDVCDEDRLALGIDLLAQINSYEAVGLEVSAIEDFLLRVEDYIVATATEVVDDGTTETDDADDGTTTDDNTDGTTTDDNTDGTTTDDNTDETVVTQ